MKISEIIELQEEPLAGQLKTLFRTFPSDAYTTIRTYKTGRIFIQEGEPCLFVYILLKGAAETFWLQPGHGQYTAMYNQPLTILGDLAPLCNYTHYSASLRTLEDSTFIVIETNVYMGWLEKCPETYRDRAVKNLRMLAAQGRFTRSTSTLNNGIRILGYLIWSYDMATVEASQEFILRRTRDQMVEDIGGISLRTLNRYLSAMEQKNFFTIVKGKIHIAQNQAEKIRHFIENHDKK